jgi:hypothetical protein
MLCLLNALRKIVETTDGSMGGSDLEGDLEYENIDKAKDDDEEDYGEDFLASMDEDADDANDHGELMVVVNAP